MAPQVDVRVVIAVTVVLISVMQVGKCLIKLVLHTNKDFHCTCKFVILHNVRK